MEQLAKVAEEKEKARLQEELERTEREAQEMKTKAHEKQVEKIEPVDITSTNIHSDSTSSLSSSSSSSSLDNGNGSTDTNQRQLLNTTTSRRSFSLNQRSPTAVKEWIRQLINAGSATSVATLLMVLALIGLLRGFRGKWSEPLKMALTKLWQTVQMGTKVTYL